MDYNKSMFLEEVALDFDLERIANLSLFEKFKFDDYVTLIYQEALFAEKEGIRNLDKSPNYTRNKTYTLFAMLVLNGTKPEILREIIMNYARSFEKSDTYYAKIAIMGIGLLMIVEEYPADAIFNYLMLLLGRNFLLENKKYDGCPGKYAEIDLELADAIEYKPFEGELRKLKYDMLALLKLSHEKGKGFVKELINDGYGNDELKFFFNMMDVESPEMSAYLYNEFMQSDSRHRRILISGSYAILSKYDVFSTHYIFNSIIGKYSRYDKDSGEIEAEVQAHVDDIMKMD